MNVEDILELKREVIERYMFNLRLQLLAHYKEYHDSDLINVGGMLDAFDILMDAAETRTMERKVSADEAERHEETEDTGNADAIV